jgi:hypothetical protein
MARENQKGRRRPSPLHYVEVITGDFGLGTKSLRNKELIKAVYVGVVNELEKLVDEFD